MRYRVYMTNASKNTAAKYTKSELVELFVEYEITASADRDSIFFELSEMIDGTGWTEEEAHPVFNWVINGSVRCQ